MYSAFDRWAYLSHMLTVISMFSPCTQWVFGPLSPVIIKIGRTINIDQCDYLNTVLQRCGMENAKSAATPLPAGYMPEPAAPDATIDPELRSRYQTVIGSLLYLTLGTRPDIAFAVTKLAQYAARPTKEHLQKVLNICRYLVGTKNYCITYNGSSGQGLMACTDSN